MTSEGERVEPRWLTIDIVLALHARQIERYGGTHGVLDENVVRSALARPRQRWAYDEGADLADLAATLLTGFGRAQGFNDGNKRTGLAACLVFLSLNDRALHVPPPELYALCMRVATTDADDEIVAAYLRDRMEPHT